MPEHRAELTIQQTYLSGRLIPRLGQAVEARRSPPLPGAGGGTQFGRVRLGGAQPVHERALALGGHLGEVFRQVLGQLVADPRRQVGERRAYPVDVVRDLLPSDGHAAIPRSSSSASMVVANERQVLPERVSWSRPAAFSE